MRQCGGEAGRRHQAESSLSFVPEQNKHKSQGLYWAKIIIELILLRWIYYILRLASHLKDISRARSNSWRGRLLLLAAPRSLKEVTIFDLCLHIRIYLCKFI